MPLPFCPRILCQPVAIQTTLITNSDLFCFGPPRVGTDPLDQSGRLDITVTANVEMIACAIKTAKAVSGFQVLFGKGAVLARGAAMDHD